MFWTHKSFRKQFQSTNHSVNAWKLLRFSPYHLKLILLNLNVLKFELQYEWTSSQIFFCGYRVLQLFCRNVEGAHDIKCNQKLLELKFC